MAGRPGVPRGKFCTINGEEKKQSCTVFHIYRVDINLAEDKDHKEIPFHISCRFQENVLIRNHKTNNAFGVEEKSANPLKAGEDFTVLIFVGKQHFHLSINTKHFCDFAFRVPLPRVKVLQVLQDVEFIRRVDHTTAYPSPYPLPYFRDTNFSFSSDVPAQLTKGQVIVLHANALGNAKGSFSVHFLNSQAPKTAIVFNVALPPKSLLTRSFINATNEYREIDASGPKSPIVSQKPFKIAFGFGDQSFFVAINGQKMCEYKYQNGMRTYSGIKVTEHDGLLLNVLGVDHHLTQDVQLRSFELFSR